MSIKRRLIERALKPFNALKKHGDIVTISEKIGGFIFRYGLGVPLDVTIALIAGLAIPVVSLFESNESKELEKQQIDLSKASLLIRPFITLSGEKIPEGTKKDITDLFPDLKNTFTIEDLNRAFKKAKTKFHPDNQLTGNSEKWQECNQLYEECLWHWFKTDEEKVTNPNYPKLRDKSYAHKPKFLLSQIVSFNNNQKGRIARVSSCEHDTYLIIDDYATPVLYYEVLEQDLTLIETL